MTTPGDLIYVIITEHGSNAPSVGVFASRTGAERYINSEIDRMKPFYRGSFAASDPGPDNVYDRLAWWSYEMLITHNGRAFITYRAEVVED